MANVHTAEDFEVEILKEVFGPAVSTVCFWDAESGRGRFTQVVGQDAAGAKLRVVTAAERKVMGQLKQMAADRAQTTKFWLDVDSTSD